MGLKNRRAREAVAQHACPASRSPTATLWAFTSLALEVPHESWLSEFIYALPTKKTDKGRARDVDGFLN